MMEDSDIDDLIERTRSRVEEMRRLADTTVRLLEQAKRRSAKLEETDAQILEVCKKTA
jgi:hypothetical protein